LGGSALGVAVQTMLPPKGGDSFIKRNKSGWFKDAYASGVIRIIFWAMNSQQFDVVESHIPAYL